MTYAYKRPKNVTQMTMRLQAVGIPELLEDKIALTATYLLWPVVMSGIRFIVVETFNDGISGMHTLRETYDIQLRSEQIRAFDDLLSLS
jgi:hypothetical protein